MQSRTWQWGVRTVWIIALAMWLAATHLPVPRGASAVISEWDKLIHASAYLILTLLTVAVFAKTQPVRIPIIKLAACLLLLGALDEILQGPVGRSPEFADWVADSIGVMLGLALAQLVVWGWGARVFPLKARDRISEARPWAASGRYDNTVKPAGQNSE